jgi:hypothetical protein
MINEDINFYFLDELYRIKALEKIAASPGGFVTGLEQFGKAFGGRLLEHGETALQGARNLGRSAAGHIAAPFMVFHPEGKYLTKGMQAMTNTSEAARNALKLDMAAKAEQGHKYIADFHSGTGILDKMRQSGWLSNTPKYLGDSKLETAKNTLMRALPGQRSMTLLPAGYEAVQTLRHGEDPTTGRKIGLGERIGGAAMGVGTAITTQGLVPSHGIGGMAGSMIGGHIGSRIGTTMGRGGGRAIDEGISRFTGRTSGVPTATPTPVAPISSSVPNRVSTPIGTPQ